MRRALAISAALFALCYGTARAQQGEPGVPVAIVLRIGGHNDLLTPEGRSGPFDDGALVSAARDVTDWMHELEGRPFLLAVSPALCEALELTRSSGAKQLLVATRAIARRGAVPTVPYADVWLPFLRSERAVADQLRRGRTALRRCLSVDTADTLFAHVLNTGVNEPVEDLDLEAVRAAQHLGLRTVIARGDTTRPVHDGLGRAGFDLVPFTTDEPTSPGVMVFDASLEHRTRYERLVEESRITPVDLGTITEDVPKVQVAYPDDPDLPRSTRDDVAAAGSALSDFEKITHPDVEVRRRFGVAYARALATASLDADNRKLGESSGYGERLAATLREAILAEFAKLDVADGTITFTSRSGTVPVTVSTKTSYPVRVRVSVKSPKLDFRDASSRVVTVAPPGDTITFAANARSTGTFPVTVVVRTPDRSLEIDTAELSVRSVAANVPAIVLTGGGALFLIVWLGRRVRRGRRT